MATVILKYMVLIYKVILLHHHQSPHDPPYYSYVTSGLIYIPCYLSPNCLVISIIKVIVLYFPTQANILPGDKLNYHEEGPKGKF